MFERKLIRHPYGHEEVLIVDGAVLRQHDLPFRKAKTMDVQQMLTDVALRMWDYNMAEMEKLRKIFSRDRGPRPVPTV